MPKVTPEDIKKYDVKDVLGSTDLFVQQCREIHELLSSFTFLQEFTTTKNIVFSSMGGSAYGGQVAQALLKYSLDIPTYINNDYDLPEFVDEHTLVILSSYSGTTEETLQSFEEARSRGAKIIALTTGGKLGEVVKGEGYDAVVFEAKSNPSGQPRLGTGYMVFGTIELLRAIKFISFTDENILQCVDEAEGLVDTIKTTAQEHAEKIYGSVPVIFAAHHLYGNAHILRNQFNETSKSFSSYHLIPEANHHLLEGLKNPEDRKLVALMIESDFYPAKIKKRVELTKDVVGKNNMEVVTFAPDGKEKLTQVLEVLMYGGYLTFYLGILYKQDPSLIPWVDYFKEKLAK